MIIENSTFLVIQVLIFVAFFYFIFKKIRENIKKYQNYDMYLFDKRGALTREQYITLLKREASQITAMVSLAENKKIAIDPKYKYALEVITKEQEKIDRNLL